MNNENMGGSRIMKHPRFRRGGNEDKLHKSSDGRCWDWFLVENQFTISSIA